TEHGDPERHVRFAVRRLSLAMDVLGGFERHVHVQVAGRSALVALEAVTTDPQHPPVLHPRRHRDFDVLGRVQPAASVAGWAPFEAPLTGPPAPRALADRDQLGVAPVLDPADLPAAVALGARLDGCAVLGPVPAAIGADVAPGDGD